MAMALAKKWPMYLSTKNTIEEILWFKDIFEKLYEQKWMDKFEQRSICIGLSVKDKSYEDNSGGPTRFFIVRSASPINNSELYTSARTLALSFSYYGLCMRNRSYNVRLHFVEMLLTLENIAALGGVYSIPKLRVCWSKRILTLVMKQVGLGKWLSKTILYMLRLLWKFDSIRMEKEQSISHLEEYMDLLLLLFMSSKYREVSFPWCFLSKLMRLLKCERK
ncbi:probable leucine-rich repeat receptor-like serine/threonine-protein kinase [Tanacetum coccineum]